MILDGTVLPIDRIAADAVLLGEEEAPGMNMQVLADPAGRLIWASDALLGAVHALTAARTHGHPTALTADGIKCWADKAYQGSGRPLNSTQIRVHPARVSVPRTSPRTCRPRALHASNRCPSSTCRRAS